MPDRKVIEASQDLPATANLLRRAVLDMVYRAKSSHVGSAYSIIDLLSVLYFRWLRVDPSDPKWADRDRFILSKAHAGAALYATLAHRGFFSPELLATYCQNGGTLPGHADSHGVAGVELSAGALGHGLPVAVGMALAAKHDGKRHRVVTILSDGECNEGSVWEAALLAPTHNLDNLTVIVDYNKLQGMGDVNQIVRLEPFADKWAAFGWGVREIDGHDLAAIEQALEALPFKPGHPSAIIAHTVKGKGVSFMENDVLWHYRTPDPQELVKAQAELAEKS